MVISNDLDLTRLEYNGISFSVYNTKVSSTPIMDEAKRTVKYVTHVITIEAEVFAVDPDSELIFQQTTETELSLMRQQLSKSGKVLTFFDKGFGNLNINQDDVFDVKFGPIPRVLEWKPVGDNLAAHVVFQIETTIPECDGAKYRYGIADLSYSSSTSIDLDGYLTRNISGYIEIPMTRLNGGTRVDDHVDRYREMTVPEPMLGFQRTRSDWSCSADKRSARFSYTDSQLVTALPEFCTHFGLSEDYSSNLQPGAFRTWQFTLSGQINMAAGMSKRSSLRLFLLTLRSRLDNFVGFGSRRRTVRTRQAILEDFRISNPITGHGTTYSATFRLLQVNGLQGIFNDASIWEPIPGTNFEIWRSSMQNSAFRVRGSFDYKENEDDEVLIDLCSNYVNRNDRPDPGIGENQDDQPGNQRPPQRTPDRGTDLDQFLQNILSRQGGQVGGVQDRANYPPEESSWVAYNIAISYTEDDPGRYARHKPMSSSQTVDLRKNIIDITDNASQFLRSKEGDLPTTRPKSESEYDILQEVATPSPRFYLYGFAVRFGYRIPAPKLVKVGKRPARRNRVLMWDEKIVSVASGVPIFAVMFQIEYLLDSVPRGPLPVPANPLLGINGSDA